MSTSGRLDAFQQRHRWASFPIAVIYKFTEDQGPYLAALITYYGFLALFPLLLLLTSILGFVLQGDPELQRRILDSTLSQFPVIGDELGDPQGLHGSGIALVIGGLIALYGALGVAQAIQNTMNVTWAVPRNRRPNPIRARLRSLLVIVIGGGAALTTTVLSALGSSATAFGAELAGWTTLLVMLAAVAVNAGIFLLAFRVSTAHPTSMRDLVPGAVIAALVWQLLQLFGTAYVGNVVKGAGAAYGVFALVLGLLGWIYLGALGVVIGAEINVVRAKRLYPRALMTPFTDNVDLTSADRHAYTDAATMQRAKGFENVAVTFDHDGQHATARRAERAEQDEPA
ncbi:MAG: YihY/virulence factor BrkB family protein [Actinobacteria bacterium]|nr:YihY/virulence factor BrkB family protein [Actinomycetota bacterium]